MWLELTNKYSVHVLLSAVHSNKISYGLYWRIIKFQIKKHKRIKCIQGSNVRNCRLFYTILIKLLLSGSTTYSNVNFPHRNIKVIYIFKKVWICVCMCCVCLCVDRDLTRYENIICYAFRNNKLYIYI